MTTHVFIKGQSYCHSLIHIIHTKTSKAARELWGLQTEFIPTCNKTKISDSLEVKYSDSLLPWKSCRAPVRPDSVLGSGAPARFPKPPLSCRSGETLLRQLLLFVVSLPQGYTETLSGERTHTASLKRRPIRNNYSFLQAFRNCGQPRSPT